MESKLTLQILSAYLPWHPQLYNSYFKSYGILKAGIVKKFETYGEMPAELKLLLRPLSDLTKEITHNGETFVPLVKLASIQFPEVEFTIEDERCFGRLNAGVVLEFVIEGEIPFYKEYHNNIFGQAKSEDYDDMFLANINPSEVREKLLKWHFDLFNLLESGDALPLNEHEN